MVALQLATLVALANAVLAAVICTRSVASVEVSQLRLALAGDYDMAVSFNTPTEVSTPTILFGTSADNLNQKATGVSQTYATSTTFSNHVKLSTLAAGTTYYYQIQGDSTVRQFTTAPTVGDQPEWSFAYVADLGVLGPLGLDEGSTHTTIDSLQSELDSYNFIFHNGDIAYADAWLSEELVGYIPEDINAGIQEYELLLNTFYNQTSVLSSAVPYMVSPGNHEANCDDGGSGSFDSSICPAGQNNFTGYNSHWRMPSAESGGTDNMWYSFNYGNVHVVVYNTETDLGKGITAPDAPGGDEGVATGPFGSSPNAQVEWLTNDLKAVDRSQTPWIIAAGHRPWYAAKKNKNLCTDCQTAFEKILYDAGVDVVFNGHVHNYERINPTYNGKVDKNGMNNPSAPWYLVNGIAGHYNGSESISGNHNPAGFAFGIDTTYGWSRVIVHNSTHLTQEFVASNNNTVLDSATLFKQHST